MEPVDVEAVSLGVGAGHSWHSRERSLSEEASKIELHLRLMETAPQQMPRWMRHYRIASYIIYSTIACYSVFYLIFVGIHQANPRFQIQYSAIVRYLEYNSYSILSPLLCPILMIMLMYHVKYRVKLDEGDFFGILGLLLFLALLNFHDGWGIIKILHWNRYNDVKTKAVLDPPPKDETSRNDLHWQYAWSTRTVCARKYVRDLQYKYEYSKKHAVRQILFQNPNPIHRSVDLEPEKIECNKYHDIKSRAKIRGWMADIQNEFKCCGPYGYNQWKEWFDNETSTGCQMNWIDKDTGDIESCFEPVVLWLDKIMLATYWIMLTQAIFYLICMFLAGLHHSAMKFETQKVEKRCSLLSMTDTFAVNNQRPYWWAITRPADNPVVVGEYPLNQDELAIAGERGLLSLTGHHLHHEGSDSSDGKSSRGRRKRKLRGIAELMNTLNRLGTLGESNKRNQSIKMTHQHKKP